MDGCIYVYVDSFKETKIIIITKQLNTSLMHSQNGSWNYRKKDSLWIGNCQLLIINYMLKMMKNLKKKNERLNLFYLFH